jgi:hypothetical protein
LYNKYSINPPAFEHSANLIAELVSPANQNIIRKGDLLLAYSNSEPRGITEACFVPDLNRYVFILSMFSNSNQEKLSFRIKSAANNVEEVISEEVVFRPDEVYGAAMAPFRLHLANPTGLFDRVAEASLEVFPNPVANKLQIVSEALVRSVEITSMSGNCLQQLSNISEYTLTLNTANLVTGMYMLKIETEKGIVIRKLIKTNNR